MEKREQPVIILNELLDIYGLITALIILIVTLVLFILWQRRKSVGNSILLTGLSDSGKTVIYTRLSQAKFAQTHTSVKENIDTIIINDKSLQLVDIPGHDSLRYKFFDKYKNSAKGVVYVIDSVTLQEEIRDAAEFLYTLLSDTSMQNNIHLLILCNKQDQTLAKGCNVVQNLLEKEIDLLRLTKSNQLEATDASTINSFIGKQGKPFKFSHLSIKVDFAESGATDITQLESWLQKLV